MANVKNAALPEKEEVLQDEDMLLRGLIEAGSFKEEIRRKITISRSGKVLFSFSVRPLDEAEEMACLRKATKQLPNPVNRKLGTVDGKTDGTKFRSLKIYTATIDEDKARIWDNPRMKTQLGAMTNIDLIDAVLRSGDKDKVIDIINEISGSGEDNDRIKTDDDEATETPSIEEYAKN